MAQTPLWAVTLDDLLLPVRAWNVLTVQGCTKAWHAAVLCDACLLRTRNFGTKSLLDIRAALLRHGFPASVRDCQWRGYDRDGHWLTQCLANLRVCRTMLEQGQWPA